MNQHGRQFHGNRLALWGFKIMYITKNKRPRSGVSYYRQRGGALILIIAFALPIFALAYSGLVVKPGMTLLAARSASQAADDADLTLAYECSRIPECFSCESIPLVSTVGPGNDYELELTGASSRVPSDIMEQYWDGSVFAVYPNEGSDCIIDANSEMPSISIGGTKYSCGTLPDDGRRVELHVPILADTNERIVYLKIGEACIIRFVIASAA